MNSFIFWKIGRNRKLDKIGNRVQEKKKWKKKGREGKILRKKDVGLEKLVWKKVWAFLYFNSTFIVYKNLNLRFLFFNSLP